MPFAFTFDLHALQIGAASRGGGGAGTTTAAAPAAAATGGATNMSASAEAPANPPGAAAAAAAARGPVAKVWVQDMRFHPAEITVPVGGSVQWEQAGNREQGTGTGADDAFSTSSGTLLDPRFLSC